MQISHAPDSPTLFEGVSSAEIRAGDVYKVMSHMPEMWADNTIKSKTHIRALARCDGYGVIGEYRILANIEKTIEVVRPIDIISENHGDFALRLK